MASEVNTMKGVEWGHLVTASNDSKTDGKIVAIFSFDPNDLEKLKDSMRPTGCCCTIF